MDSVQIETGKISLQVNELELTSLVQEICRIQSQVNRTHRIVFEAGGECRIIGDPRLLERVVTNLMSNAVKYSPPNSAVLLKVWGDDSKAVITVKDEGAGMSKDEIQELFQPFQRLSRTGGLAEGTGLGLFSVKRIVEAHGGAIDVDSAPGAGTTVAVTLPVTDSHETQ
jgi:signal transduction histidine kinase